MNREFFCDVCLKQYKNIAEMTAHLDGYDHHHRKRLLGSSDCIDLSLTRSKKLAYLESKAGVDKLLKRDRTQNDNAKVRENEEDRRIRKEMKRMKTLLSGKK